MRAFTVLALTAGVVSAGPIQARQPFLISLGSWWPFGGYNNVGNAYVANNTPTTTSVKSTTPTTTKTTTVNTATSTTSSAPTSTGTGTGPCANGADVAWTYKAPGGDVYGICTGTEFPGSDMGSVVGTTVVGCADSCINKAGCVAGSWSVSQQLCYLKSAGSGAKPNSSMNSVVKIGSKGVITTSKPTTAVPTATKPAINSTLSTIKVPTTTPASV